MPSYSRSDSGRQRSRISDLGVLLFVAIVLISHGLIEFSHESPAGLVLALAGFVSVPMLCVVAVRLSRDVRSAQAGEAAKARLLDGAESTGQELIWEIDPIGKVTYMSGIARQMFGIDPADILGKSVFNVLPESEQPGARAILEECARTQTGWTGLILEGLDGHGGTQLIETTGVAQFNKVGDLIGFTATTRRLDDDSVRRVALGKVRDRIVDVIDNNLIRTFFQPIVCLRTGRVLGHEALSRFAAQPAQPPDRWFADAEEVGLGAELDLKAVRSALAAAHELPPDGYVSINAAPATLAADCLVPTIAESGIPFHRIIIELTEHVSVDDYQALREPLDELRRRGVRVAVDDAGSGYASFRHILRLQPDIIKLDRDIVRDIDHDPARAALASAMVTFAHEIGAEVTAEGIETAAEHTAVANLGIDAGQGYLFAAPSQIERPSAPAPNAAPSALSPQI